MIAFVPMAFWPLKWAAVLGWQQPVDSHLTVYYGRCLGCVAFTLGAAGLYAAVHPGVQLYFFQIMTCNFSIMTIVHIYGAVKKVQPARETYEIVLWLGLVLASLIFWPTIGSKV